MRILNISLSNFLCYYGENNRLEFVEGLNLILGANGYGKSKLYDAFQWVFRDGISDDRPRQNTAPNAIRPTSELKHTLINERALTEAEVGAKICCEVCIEVLGSQNATYQLIRRLYANKISTDNFLAATNSQLEVNRKDVLDFKPLSETEGKRILSQLIPSDIMPYLWFQGERGVSNLIDTSSRESLKQVIKKMSDVDKWDGFIEASQAAFATAEKELRQALHSDTTRNQIASNLENEQNKVQTKLECTETELAEVEKNLELVTKKQEAIIGQLSAASSINELHNKQKQKKGRLAAMIQEFDNLKLGFTRRLFTDYWVMMGSEALVDEFERKYLAYSQFVQQRKDKQSSETGKLQTQTRLPEGIPDRVHVNDMLNREHCLVCDREAPKGSPAYAAIEKLLPKPIVTPTSANTPDIEPELRMMNRAAFLVRGKYAQSNTEIAAVYERQDTLQDERQELEAELKDLDSAIANELLNSGLTSGESAADVALSFNGYQRDINKYTVRRTRLQDERDVYLAKLKDIEDRVNKLSQGAGIDPKLLQKKELLADLHDLAKRTKNVQYAALIQKLEDTANEHFARINQPTGAVYGKIKFVQDGDGFVPEIHDDSDKRMANLNTSQLSSSKLAIIMAIVTANSNRGYANHYPLISDAPTSDFDSGKTKAFLAETAQTFGQSIIIVKDFLEADASQPGHYVADKSKLILVKEDVEAAGKKMKAYQLVIASGTTTQNRKNLAVQVSLLSI